MPSVIIANVSGGQNIISGMQWSGRIVPVGGVQLRVDKAANGSCYFGLSGGVTIQSGGFPLSGGSSSGLLDGMQVGAGDSYFIPKLGYGLSGQPQIFAATDATGSGQSRVFWEIF